MSTLGEAVLREVAKKGFDTDLATVEQTLLHAGIATSATTGVPVKLRIARVQFSGTKNLDVPADAADNVTADAHPKDKTEAMVNVPFAFSWNPADGVNGIGSAKNLRGKSSVMHVITWALTGRCTLQTDVRSWVRHVEVEWCLDNTRVVVAFDAEDGLPTGVVQQVKEVAGVRSFTTLGAFSTADEFASVMGALMLERLRLDPIVMWGKDQETSHAWPAYASALAVHADRLDPVVGNEPVLGSRMLQMFVGTSWAAARAQAATARRGQKFERDRASEQARVVADVAKTALTVAEDKFSQAQAHLESFADTDPDVDTILALAGIASDLAREARDLSRQLLTAQTAASQVSEQLRADELRRNSALEDALARRFFNRMTPTVCPRCAAEVTQERREAEPHDHACSLCSSDLDLHAFSDNVVIAAAVPVETRAEIVAAASEAEAERKATAEAGTAESEDDAEVADPLVALQQAAQDADVAVAELETRLAHLEDRQREAEGQAQSSRAQIESARARLQAELELARAQGSLETLRETAVPVVQVTTDETTFAIIEVADRLTGAWLKGDQDPLLVQVSAGITALARSFGSDNITAVSLKGNANMDIDKGGIKTGYSSLTDGEKLRLKLATAIALIEHGHRKGVGRHPGLLFIDSPGAEEVPVRDLETMLKAMMAIAEETSMQMFVATTHGAMLSSLLPRDSVRVASGDDYVW